MGNLDSNYSDFLQVLISNENVYGLGYNLILCFQTIFKGFKLIRIIIITVFLIRF